MIEFPRPESSEFPAYYAPYIARVPAGDLLAVLQRQGKDFTALVRAVPEGRASFRYEPGKWSVKQVVGHVCDAERIFTYRALCFSRDERAPLPGFDENTYAPASGADLRPIAELAAEFEAIRGATLALFGGMSESMLTNRGIANGNPLTVRAIAYIVAGHAFHHAAVLNERYLK